MGLMTSEEYINSLRKMKYRSFIMGERVENSVDHPLVRPSINAIAKTYELAHTPESKELATATSHLTGEPINRFTNIQQSREDLIKKIKFLRLLGQKTATCFQRCAGLDDMNAVFATTYEIDKDCQTNYHERFKKFMKYVQGKDLVCSAAMTDPKGDRSKGPGEQASEDIYLKVLEKKSDGIVVSGAKCHITGALNSHEILVVPTRAMDEKEKDYAVAFAVPADSPGITYIYGRQPSDTRKMEDGNIDMGNVHFGGQEALTIFDKVFVPWERVFMYGEYPYCGRLVDIFASYHRSSYGGCKTGVIDVLIGATSLLAEYQGTSKATHVKDKLIEMTQLNETLYAAGLASATEGYQLPCGSFCVNGLLANVCKLNVTKAPFEISRLAIDIAGGILVTLPSEKDLRHPELGTYMRKYLGGVANVATESRMKLLRLIENMTMGSGAVCLLAESVHGAGSPQAQRIMISRQANLEHKQKLAKEIAIIS